MEVECARPFGGVLGSCADTYVRANAATGDQHTHSAQ